LQSSATTRAAKPTGKPAATTPPPAPSPAHRARRTVTARYVHNDRLVDALNAQAFAALTASPGARAFYDQQRASGHGHNDTLRRLANRLVGILHGCRKTRTLSDEDTA
jgi:hypothetical protein